MSTADIPAPGATEEPDEETMTPDEAPPSEIPLVPNADQPFDAGTPPMASDGATDEACSDCLSNECPEAIESCNATPGCQAITACARSTGCLEDACYCGAVNPLLCAATGQGDGPCRDVILAAPESHEPTPVAPNGGPASEAAQLVGDCRRASIGCRDLCGGPGD